MGEAHHQTRRVPPKSRRQPELRAFDVEAAEDDEPVAERRNTDFDMVPLLGIAAS